MKKMTTAMMKLLLMAMRMTMWVAEEPRPAGSPLPGAANGKEEEARGGEDEV